MKKYYKLFALAFAALLTLGPFAPFEPMQSQGHHREKEATARHCVAACSPLPTEDRLKEFLKKEEDEPHPIAAEPYYATFLGGLYTAAIGLAILFTRHLRWRPPDLALLYSNLRF